MEKGTKDSQSILEVMARRLLIKFTGKTTNSNENGQNSITKCTGDR